MIIGRSEELKKLKAAMAAVAAGMALAAPAVELVRDDAKGVWTVANAHYKVTLEAKRGYRIAALAYGKVEKGVFGEFDCGFDGQSLNPSKISHDALRMVVQAGAKDAAAEVVEEKPGRLVLRFSWPLPDGGKVVQTVAYDDTPVVRYEQALDWTKPMGAVLFRLYTLQMKTANGRFLPENRTFTGVNNQGERSILPRWKYLTDGKFGFGVIAPEGEEWDHFEFHARTAAKGSRGSWGDQGLITLNHRDHANDPLPGKLTTRFALVLTADPAEAFACARAELKSAPAVQLCDLEPDKVFSEKGRRNGLTTTLVNNAAEERTVKVVVELATGLKDVRTVGEETLTLKPGEMRVYKKDWDYPQDFEWGVAMRVKLYEGDTLLDARSDVVSVADRGFAAAGTGIINVGMANQEGAEAAWADVQRRTYIGALEYYAWSHATWDPDRQMGQAPVADSWDACSDSQTGYRAVLTKKFLKKLIADCHARGIHVYDWITGLCNYKQAFAHPDKFQYCKNGQLQIYAGRVWGKERFAVAKIAPYTVEDSADWGDQTADSVDMFGWDGCRWDWGFLPCAPNDPLYMSEMASDPDALVWYDWKGRKSTDLFPDPDTTGTECLKAWRAAVNRRHPKFVYTTNFDASESVFRLTPKYAAEATRDGLALLEYLSSSMGRGETKTYRTWGRTLAEATQRCRRNGSHTEVGAIWAYTEGSVCGQLARYVCNAAGSKWWGSPFDFRYWTAKHRSLPFAMRFSEYFWGLDFRLVPVADCERKVVVADGGRTLWKEFVYEREKDGFRELVVHVINVNGDDHIRVKQADVKPFANLPARVFPAADERLAEAWGLVPGDEPAAIPLDVADIRLPKLEEAAVFLFRFVK